MPCLQHVAALPHALRKPDLSFKDLWALGIQRLLSLVEGVLQERRRRLHVPFAKLGRSLEKIRARRQCAPALDDSDSRIYRTLQAQSDDLHEFGVSVVRLAGQ